MTDQIELEGVCIENIENKIFYKELRESKMTFRQMHQNGEI
jgi:hypothetical protein